MRGDDAGPDLEALVRRALARQLALDPAQIDARERFHRYGLDSAGARSLIQGLARELGRPLPATIVWDHPTLERLARHLAGEATGSLRPPPVPLAPDEPIAIVGLACRLPGRRRPGGLLAAAHGRRRRDPRGAGRPLADRAPVRRRPGQARADEHPVGRLPGPGRPVRRGLLPDQPARGGPDGPAAAPGAGAGLGGVRGRRLAPVGAGRPSRRRLPGCDVERLRPRC